MDALCASNRPESILVWKRSPKVQALLGGLGDGTIPVTCTECLTTGQTWEAHGFVADEVGAVCLNCGAVWVYGRLLEGSPDQWVLWIQGRDPLHARGI